MEEEIVCYLCRKSPLIATHQKNVESQPSSSRPACQPSTITIPCSKLLCAECEARLRSLESLSCKCLIKPTPSPDIEVVAEQNVKVNNSRAQALELIRRNSDAKSRQFNKETCIVTHVVSPWLIYIYNEALGKKTESEERIIQTTLSQFSEKSYEKSGGFEADVGDDVIVYFKRRSHRAKVINKEESVARCFLVDTGEECLVNYSFIQPMPEELRKILGMALPVYLDGIVPAGSSQQEWPMSAIDFTKECLGKGQIKIQLKQSTAFQDPIDGKKKHVVEMFFEEEPENSDPFGPPVDVTVGLKDALVKNGYALRKGSTELDMLKKSVEMTDQKLLKDDTELRNAYHIDSELKDSMERYNQGFKLSGKNTTKDTNQEEDPKKELQEEELQTEEPQEAEHLDEEHPDEDYPDEEPLELTKEAIKWKGPAVMKDKEFEGQITYIDREGQIYAQPKCWKSRLRDIEDKLNKIHRHRKSTAEDLYWNVGDLCAVLHCPSPNKTWHRGLVTEVGEEVVEVLFVDYGESMRIFPSRNEIHKEIGFEECVFVPIMCLRLVLDRVEPKGDGYKSEFLDEIHKEIVEKDAHFKLCSTPLKFPIRAIIHAKLEADKEPVNLGRMFFKRGVCRKILTVAELGSTGEMMDERREQAGFFIQPEEESTSYEDEPVRHNVTKEFGLDSPGSMNVRFPCQVVGISGDDKVLVQLFFHEEENISDFVPDQRLRNKLKENYKDFVEMAERINRSCFDTYPKVFDVEPGVLCVAKYPEDGVWYRAEISKVSDGKVSVCYVDYGNSAVVSQDDIRELPATEMVVPRQVATFKINGSFTDNIDSVTSFTMIDPNIGIVKLHW